MDGKEVPFAEEMLFWFGRMLLLHVFRCWAIYVKTCLQVLEVGTNMGLNCRHKSKNFPFFEDRVEYTCLYSVWNALRELSNVAYQVGDVGDSLVRMGNKIPFKGSCSV